VRVPEEAGLGTAKLTFSFEAWKDGKAASSTVELPVVKPESAIKAASK
jgi:hypothetical protein